MTHDPSPAAAAPEVKATPRLIAILVALTLAVIAVLLVIAELLLARTVRLPLRTPAPQVAYDPHPLRRFTLRPSQEAYTYQGRVRVGADGLRAVVPAPPPAACRVVAGVGDSFTFGMGVHDEETWPSRLAASLAERGVQAAVHNLGTISYGTAQELHLLDEHRARLGVTLVVHALYWNDYHGNAPPRPGEPAPLDSAGHFVWDSHPTGGASQALQDVVQRSRVLWASWRLLARLRARASAATADEFEYERVETALEAGRIDTAAFAPVREFYRALRARGQAEGFDVYAVIMPVHGVMALPDPASQPYPAFARRLLAEEGVPFLDAHAVLAAAGMTDREFLPYNKHLDAAGYALIGSALADSLVRGGALARVRPGCAPPAP